MNTSERDAWLKALLPGILTGVIYVFWFARPGFQQLSAANEEAARSRESIPSVSVVSARKQEVDELTARQDVAQRLNGIVVHRHSRWYDWTSGRDLSSNQREFFHQLRRIQWLADISIHAGGSVALVGPR